MECDRDGLRSQKKDLDLGGHISTFQSAATMYEVCYNHFFKAATEKNGGDLIFFQGHAAPGMYARAFLEGRLTEEQMDNFRQKPLRTVYLHIHTLN